MFQQGGKFYLNASNWKRYQPLNYTNSSNNNKKKDRYQDIDNPNTQQQQQHQHQQKEHLKKLTCNFKHLNRLRKTKSSNSQKTGLRKANSLYSVSSVKERLANEAGSNTGIDIYRFKQKMANTLSVMTNVLRNVVSKQRIRYKEKGFNLDLAYVCDNIIAMGYPADNYESMYRNPLGDVYKFLEDNHHDHYKIYNLCLERSYDISKFHGRVSVYPFEDHNPPTIELIQKFCDDVDNWLKADTLNVAAVHCKAGKGRTGTMICCYLLYSGQQRTAEDALACYDEKRTKDRKGVTIPSQRRYVQYFSKLMRLGLTYERRTLQFCEIRFSKANTLHSQGSVHCSISVLQDKVQQLQNFPIDFRKHNVLDMKNPPLPVAGDIKVELTKNTKKIFHFWFNTFFVSDSSVMEGEGNDVKFVYTLQKWEIDDVHKDKCYPEDFKVELVFYVDDTNVDRDHMKVSSSNRLTSNHRTTTMQNAGAVRMSTQNQREQQSNNYSLPQNNSSGSEMNYLCDQKSSSSTSVSSSLGVGGGTDISNGYESIRSTAQRKIGVVPTFGNHHSNHYMTNTDVVNNSEVFSAPTPAQHMTLPPSYMDQHQQQQLQHHHPQQQQQQQKQQHKNNMPQMNQQQKNMMTLATTTNQRHLQRQVAGGGGGGDVHAHHPNNMDAATFQPSTNVVNANKSSSNSSSGNNSTHNMASNSYNHNHSNNSSKTSSVSSQSSSSAIGDNEEDWESGESQAKQLEHITLQLSTSSITNPTLPPSTPPPSSTTTSPSNQPAPPHSTTTNPTSFPNTLRNCKNSNSGIRNSSNTNTSSSNSSSSTSLSSASKCPSNNKSKTSNSSCTNRVVGGDDDDDNNKNKNNDDDRKFKFKKLNSNQVVKQVPNTSTDTNTKSVEFKVGDNNITSSIACEAEVPPNNRPKFMHLLMAPKNLQQQQQQSPHKPIFKRKSSYKLVKGSNSNGSTFTSGDCSEESLGSSAVLAAGIGGGVAISSKLKLKIKLKKNKLKLSQKFQWFQNYFRTDPVDFCENFVQQTTSMRRNSMCSMASRTHKLSTTTPPSVTPPPPVVNAGSSCEQLDRATSVNSVSTSNASIATGDLCEDYYSSICDNQLSFSNSPCKSPRSMADMASSISGGRAGGVAMSHGSSFGSSFTRSAGVSNSYLRERRETLPGCSSSSHANNNSRRNSNNVVIVAAKPAKIHAIGFNVKTTTNLARQDSFETNGEEDDDDLQESPASIYYTPSSALIPTGDVNDQTNTAFVFPQLPQASDKSLENVEQKPKNTNVSTNTGSMAKPQAKYSLNLVIVKECTEPPPSGEITKPPSAGSNNESDGIDSDCCDIGHKKINELRLQDDIGSAATLSEDVEMGKVTATTTAASVCSNSSSSGFCTSECCTTNSSSSSCNCNPFAIDLERHVASAKQEHQQQHSTIQEVVETATNDNNDDGDTNENEAIKANVAEVSLNSNTEVPTTSTNDKCDQ